jgi:Family of unknown function (DUF6364)
MNVTLSLDDKLIKEVRKIAIDHDTTLTGLVRSYLEKLAAESRSSGRKRREGSSGAQFRTVPIQRGQAILEKSGSL